MVKAMNKLICDMLFWRNVECSMTKPFCRHTFQSSYQLSFMGMKRLIIKIETTKNTRSWKKVVRCSIMFFKTKING